MVTGNDRHTGSAEVPQRVARTQYRRRQCETGACPGNSPGARRFIQPTAALYARPRFRPCITADSAARFSVLEYLEQTRGVNAPQGTQLCHNCWQWRHFRRGHCLTCGDRAAQEDERHHSRSRERSAVPKSPTTPPRSIRGYPLRRTPIPTTVIHPAFPRLRIPYHQ